MTRRACQFLLRNSFSSCLFVVVVFLFCLWCPTGKKKRLTLLECNNDISSMIDIAKVADLVREGHFLLSYLGTTPQGSMFKS